MKRLKLSTFVLTLILLICPAINAAPRSRNSENAREPRQRQQPEPRSRERSRSADQPSDSSSQVNEAAQQIDAELKTILMGINTQRRLDQQTLATAEQAAKTARKYVTKFEKKAQCDYSLLTAWLYHFAADPQKACLSAAKAYKADPENNDARVSQVALAIIAGKKPDLRPPATRRTQSSRSKKDPSLDFEIKRPKGILDFNVDEIRTNVIKPKVERLQLNCANSTTFSYAPGDSNLCILFWQLAEKTNAPAIDIPAEQSPYEPNGLTRVKVNSKKNKQSDDEYDYILDPLEKQFVGFANIFAANINNPAVKFLAINTDSPANRSEAIREIIQNPKPWAQVIASDKQSKADMFAATKIDTEKPIMAIVSKNGTLIYTGPAAGFLAPMIVQSLTPATLADKQAYQNPTPQNRQPQVTRKEPTTPPETPTQPNSPAPTTTRTATPPTTDSYMQVGQEYQAGKDLSYAKQYIDMGKYTTYKKGVDMCRNIMRKYPDTKYAEEARKLLRKVPERHKERYNITDEETGL